MCSEFCDFDNDAERLEYPHEAYQLLLRVLHNTKLLNDTCAYRLPLALRSRLGLSSPVVHRSGLCTLLSD